MTIDEAIQHAEKVAQENEMCIRCNDDFNFSQPKWRKCALEHRQLAKWLKEYKEMLLAIEEIKSLGKSRRILLIKGDETLSLVEDIINKHTSGKEGE